MEGCSCLLNRTLNYIEHPAVLRDPWCPFHGDAVKPMTIAQMLDALHGKKHQSNEEE
jgi:hypothetical protein